MKRHSFFVFFPFTLKRRILFLIVSIRTTIKSCGLYFVTFTCFEWLPLIHLTNSYQLVYNWFEILREKGHRLSGYVLMPNHLHMLLYYAGGQKSLNTIIGNGKRFMSYEIVKRLKIQQNLFHIEQLKLAVDPSDKRKGQLHEVWENSFDVKECRTEQFVLQKLNYIHNNPCSKNWNLSKSPEDYLYSSAAFYSGKRILNPTITHYKNLLNRTSIA